MKRVGTIDRVVPAHFGVEEHLVDDPSDSARRGRHEPMAAERRLVRAVLWRAFADLFDNQAAVHRDAWNFFFSHTARNDAWPYNMTSCCHYLDIDPDALRDRARIVYADAEIARAKRALEKVS